VLMLGWVLLRFVEWERAAPEANRPVAVAAVNLSKKQTSDVSAETAHNARLLDVVSWALNQQLKYPPGEQALANERLDKIRTLLTLLAEAGFHGQVRLLVHRGRFCTVTDSVGGKTLPPAEASLADCEIQPAGAREVQQMSLPFAMYMENSPFANGERGIHLTVTQLGDRKPVMYYPDANSGVTAGECSGIATANNRIELRLEPALTE